MVDEVAKWVRRKILNLNIVATWPMLVTPLNLAVLSDTNDFYVLASRIFALSMFATCFTKLALLGFVFHGTLMSAWLLLKPDLNHNRCDECLLNCMLGVAYIFVYISSHTGPQRYSYWWYYVICFTENIGCLCVWYVHSSDQFLVGRLVQYRSLFDIIRFILVETVEKIFSSESFYSAILIGQGWGPSFGAITAGENSGFTSNGGSRWRAQCKKLSIVLKWQSMLTEIMLDVG